MNGKEAYNKFCEIEDIPIYLTPEILDICCADGQWDVQCIDSNGKIEAVWIYYVKKKMGLSYITMPTSIKYMGPLFSHTVPDEKKQKLYDALSLLLPRVSSYEQNLNCDMYRLINQQHIAIEYKAGDTYFLDLSISTEDLLGKMNGNYRRAINKYNSEITCDLRQNADDSSINDFIQLLSSSLGSLVKHNVSPSKLRKLIFHAEKKETGKLILLRKKNEVVGGAFLLWDNKCAYYLYAGNNKTYSKIYPGVLAAWQAISYLKKHTTVAKLDFYGSSIISIAKVWVKLGAEKQCYPQLNKKPSFWFDILQRSKNTFLKK